MGLMIYNTRTRQLEPFEPVSPPNVKMYVCGLTVYDYAHIGHARTYLSYDVIIRYLKYLKYRVEVIQNITDVDDKMIRRANQEKISVPELADRFIKAASEDFKKMGIDFADYYPRATDNIDTMIQIIQKLQQKGFAYEVDGDVYFDVSKVPKYGSFSGQKIEEQQAQENATTQEHGKKRNPTDFALWKSKKAGEIAWASPWGEGRPGWHIECSAMSWRYLGEQFDIHGGGQDLIFPHHENEIAQLEAFTAKRPSVKYWMHTGFLNIKSEKMSKSLGNFITIRDLLNDYRPMAFRFLVLNSHYRNPIDFSVDKMLEATRGLESLENAIQRAKYLLNMDPKESSSERALDPKSTQYLDTLTQAREQFLKAMDNDFNTPDALAVIFPLITETQKYLRNTTFNREVIDKFLDFMTELNQIFGLFQDAPLPYEPGIGQFIQILIDIRKNAREVKNFQLADTVRDRLKQLNIELQDYPEGTMWQYVFPDPEKK